MRSFNLLVLLVIGALLCLGNLWHAALRSTIPMSIRDRVTKVELRHEKHPGKDDVYLVHFATGKVEHVDEAVAKQISDGCVLEKAAWEQELKVRTNSESDDWNSIKLEYSGDFWGMVYAMPILFLTLLCCCVVAYRRKWT